MIAFLEGKTKTERNKIIAAGVLGVVSLVALYMAFGPSFSGSSTTTATVKRSTAAKPAASPGNGVNINVVLPTAADQNFIYETTPVVYNAGNSFAPDAGRNIFAFYEPPPPTPYVAPPPPTPEPLKPPDPTPTPVFFAGNVNPQTVYAGSREFPMDVNGDRFTPDARIYFNQTELPTTFVNGQRLSTVIPDNLVAQQGPKQIIVQTPDGRSYSEQLILTVQAPPKPTSLQYIGMIGRKRYNNDTAYFLETGRPTPFGARLNDVVGGRFRLIDISTVEVVLEDVTLGFKHRVPIATTASGGSTGPGRGDGFVPFNPNAPGQLQTIPGIPNNIRVAPQPQTQKPDQKRPERPDDVDDNDDPRLK